jgi:hypothetical protein
MEMPSFVVGNEENKWDGLAHELMSYYMALLTNGASDELAMLVMMNYADKLHEALVIMAEDAQVNKDKSKV